MSDAPSSQLRRLLGGLVGIVAEALAAACVLTDRPIAVALLLHVLAAIAAAAGMPRTQKVYRAAVLVCTLAVPVLGALLAWLLLTPARDGTKNAHAFFVDYEREVTDDVELDALTADAAGTAMSFHEVLRHGSTDHRRNALRKLAARGQPMHLALLRRCLSHPDMELRLGAFREIDRLLRQWEERLDALATAAESAAATTPDDPAPQLARSAAHRAYATSGLLDRDMQRLQLDTAMAACRAARAIAPRDTAVTIEQALVFVAQEDLVGAERTLAAANPKDEDVPELCLARAQLAFRLRRFDAVAAEARRLAAAAAEVPAWMRELEVVS